jgi:Gas vesicle protein
VTEPMAGRSLAGYGRPAAPVRRPESANLADILERVLDKGIVIAGDIQVNLLDIELLTIKLRLVIASVDRAKEMGIDWWEHDPTLSSRHTAIAEENRRLRDRIAALEGRAEDEAPPVERRERGAVRRAYADEDDVEPRAVTGYEEGAGRRERRSRPREEDGRD